MTKFRLYFNKDKETIWLNDMASKGYALKNFCAGFYHFESCNPGEYQYQIDIDNHYGSVSDDYREFMEENGIEIVSVWGYWNFLRKRTSDGEFVLYTDVDSNIEHYTKILKLFKAVAIIELICFLLETIAFMHGTPVALWGMIIIGLFAVTFMYAAISTKRTINELKERKGDVTAKETTPGTVSPFLLSGLFLNAIALSLNNSESVSEPIAMTVQIIAIVFMLIGIYQSRHVFTK